MPAMRSPLANVVTLGAVDFANLRRFYRDLGWPQVVDDDDFAAFELRGIVLAVFPVEKLANDGNAVPELERSRLRSTLAIVAESPQEVDAWVEQMRRAGATVTKDAEDAEFLEGRSAYLADPEGNYWEIAWADRSNAIVAAARRAARQDQ
jgi:predicted lactoylglutathione lyase